jgi:ribosome-associated heat shock protein Hsp15
VDFPQEVRIDKWLWAVRLYKTRSLAAEACKAGHVTIAGQTVKPSRDVHVGEVINARTAEILRTVKVIGLIDRRVWAEDRGQLCGGSNASREYLRVITEEGGSGSGSAEGQGSGRPTKKDRRQMEALEGESNFH